MKALLSVVCLLSVSSIAMANPEAVPEPEMLSLMGLGVAAMLMAARRRK